MARLGGMYINVIAETRMKFQLDVDYNLYCTGKRMDSDLFCNWMEIV